MTATRSSRGLLSGLNANLIHKAGRSDGIKAYKSDDGRYGWVEGYLVSWGNAQDTDLQGEFFSPRTEFCLDWFAERPVLYHHGLDGDTGLRKIGVIKSVETDELGLWVQAQLDLRDRYAVAVYDMVKSKEFGWSSGSVDHLVKIADNGEITTWPLIEGSITPTPAQPSKTAVRAMKGGVNPNFIAQPTAPTTSYRAFKAVLEQDTSFVRGLDARVRSEFVRTKSSSLNFSEGRLQARASSKRLAREFARLYGINPTKAELEAVASEIEEQLDEEIALQVAEDMEMDATLASLEEEMIRSDEEDNPMARNYRSQTRRRRARRNDNGYAMEHGVAMDGDLSVQMDTMASDIADSIAADIEDEVKASIEDAKAEEKMIRALRRKAYRRAVRQLEATDDVSATMPGDPGVGVGGIGGDDYLGEFSTDSPPIENFKSRRRRSRRRARRMNDTYGMDELRMTDEALATEEVARRSYQNGFKRGLRHKTTDAIVAPDVVIHESNSEAGNFDLIPEGGADITTAKRRRRKTVRRARRSDESYATENNSYSSDDEDSAKAFRRGYRAALRRARRNSEEDGYAMEDEKSMRRRRARRSDDDTYAMEEEKALRRRRRARRSDEDTYAMDEEKALRRRRRARRFDEDGFGMDEEKALRRRRRARRSDDDTYAMEEEKALRRRRRARRSDEDDSYGMDEEKSMRRRSRRVRGKSASYGSDAQYWRNRAMKAELSEAPGQRGQFGRMKVRDEADRPGAYSNAFKSYLYQGLGLMTDSQKYVLKGKGRTNWGATKGTFAAPGQGALKTYFGGSDASAGFAVPPDWVAELNKNIMTQTVMAPECRTRTTTSDRIVQPNLVTTDARRAHAAEVRWPGEVITDPTTAHRTIEDQYSQVDVPIHVMLMSLTAGNSALEDVSFSLEDEINEAFSEAVAIAYDELIWSGDGQGKLQGIVVNDQVTGTRSLNMQTVSGYVPTGSPDGIVTPDVLKEMLFHLPRGYRQRSKWYMNSNTALQIATLKDGEGNYFIDERDASLQSTGGVPLTLLGKPIVINEYADDIVEDGFPIVLGDLSRGYLIGKRVDFSIRRFDDSNYAELDQVLFLGRARVGGQVLTPASMKTLKVSVS